MKWGWIWTGTQWAWKAINWTQGCGFNNWCTAE